MVEPQVLQGSWEQLSKRGRELSKYANLYLIIPAEVEEFSNPPIRSGDDSQAIEAARIAGIYATMGKFRRDGGEVAGTAELRNERNRDNEREEQSIMASGL